MGVSANADGRPSGAVTFLFTDIEGSTRRWEADPEKMRLALAVHDEVLGAALGSRGGWLFKHTGDGVCAAFATPRSAIEAAGAAQRLLELPVRMGVATGEAELRGGDYFGPALNRAARVMTAGHGGQVLVASSTAGLVDGLDGLVLVDLGERRLRDLSTPIHLFQLTGDGLSSEFAPLRTLDSVPGNLPAQSTSFVGRDGDIAEVRRLLGERRLVTLVGVGGVGKTRLALHSAAELLGEFRDGAWFVELAPLGDAEGVVEAVASVLSVPLTAGQNRTDSLVAALQSRTAMIVLDNCEHVIDRASALAETLLTGCPQLKIIATSREAFGIRAEQSFPVRSLSLGADSQSAALFEDRARLVAPDFEIGGDAAIVEEICVRLDGIPLAIELAAARVRSMSPEQIRDRLDERFRLLTGSKRSIERHQTLRHAVQWSYDLLSEVEQKVLQCVSVFSGGFSLAAAGAVCRVGPDGELDEFEILDILDSLVRKSLLQPERVQGETRYTLLETIRQFAEEHLDLSGDALTVRDRHATTFAETAEMAFRYLRSADEAFAYRVVGTDLANMQAAFGWALERDLTDTAIRIAACLHQAARNCLRTETFGWPAAVIEAAKRTGHRLLPLLLTMACDSAWGLGHLEEAKRLGHEALAASESGRYEPFVWAYSDLCQIAFFEGDVEGGLELVRLGAAHPADAHDRLNLMVRCVVRQLVGSPCSPAELADASALVRVAGVPSYVALMLTTEAAWTQDDIAAIELIRQANAILRSVGNRQFGHTASNALASRLSKTTDIATALDALGGVIDDWQLGGDTAVAPGMGRLVVLLSQLGLHNGAATLHAAITRGISLGAIVAGLDEAMATTRLSLGDSAFTSAHEAGAAMNPHTAGNLAHQLISQARTLL